MSLCHQVLTALSILALAGCSQDNSELGRPCSLGFDAGYTQGVYNSQVPECSSSLCVKPILSSYTHDYDTGPYCTTTCSSDSDCDGQERDGNDPNDKRCARGYACGIAFAVGPLCCQKLCICKDFLSDRGVVVPPNCEPGAGGQNRCGVN
jgi:hypothetical protein